MKTLVQNLGKLCSSVFCWLQFLAKQIDPRPNFPNSLCKQSNKKPTTTNYWYNHLAEWQNRRRSSTGTLCVAGKAQKSKKRLKNKQNREKAERGKTLFSRPHVCHFIYAEQQKKEKTTTKANRTCFPSVFAHLLLPFSFHFLPHIFVYLPFISSSIGLPALDDATAATL
jgi:hypothetical protein